MAEKKEDKLIWVRATDIGSYNGRRRPGDKFQVPESLFSKTWMEKIPDDEKAPDQDSNPEDSNPEDSNPEDSNPEDSNPEDSNPEDSNPEDSNPEDDSTGDASTGLV